MPYKTMKSNVEVTAFVSQRRGHPSRPPQCPPNVFEALMLQSWAFVSSDISTLSVCDLCYILR